VNAPDTELRHLLQRLVATVTAFGSLIALVLAFHQAGTPPSTVEVVAIVVFVVFTGFAVVGDVRDFRERRPHVFRSRGRANRYWWRRIHAAGRVVLLTRDMTWADEPMVRLLTEKARRGEVTIVLPRPIPLTDELAAEGATVVVYPGLGFAVQSRFVTLNADQSDSTVLIGRQRGVRDEVQEFGAGDYPVFFLTEDVRRLLTHVAARVEPG
jgi:hypothetical protein